MNFIFLCIIPLIACCLLSVCVSVGLKRFTILILLRKSLNFTIIIHKLYKLVYCYTVGIADQVSNMTLGPLEVIDFIVLH